MIGVVNFEVFKPKSINQNRFIVIPHFSNYGPKVLRSEWWILVFIQYLSVDAFKHSYSSAAGYFFLLKMGLSLASPNDGAGLPIFPWHKCIIFPLFTILSITLGLIMPFRKASKNKVGSVLVTSLELQESIGDVNRLPLDNPSDPIKYCLNYKISMYVASVHSRWMLHVTWSISPSLLSRATRCGRRESVSHSHIWRRAAGAARSAALWFWWARNNWISSMKLSIILYSVSTHWEVATII